MIAVKIRADMLQRLNDGATFVDCRVYPLDAEVSEGEQGLEWVTLADVEPEPEAPAD